MNSIEETGDLDKFLNNLWKMSRCDDKSKKPRKVFLVQNNQFKKLKGFLKKIEQDQRDNLPEFDLTTMNKFKDHCREIIEGETLSCDLIFQIGKIITTPISHLGSNVVSSESLKAYFMLQSYILYLLDRNIPRLYHCIPVSKGAGHESGRINSGHQGKGRAHPIFRIFAKEPTRRPKEKCEDECIEYYAN